VAPFFVTHDYSEIPCFGGGVLVLKEGRIVCRGTAESLFNGDREDLSRMWRKNKSPVEISF